MKLTHFIEMLFLSRLRAGEQKRIQAFWKPRDIPPRHLQNLTH